MESLVLLNKRTIEINGIKMLDLHESSVNYNNYNLKKPLIIGSFIVSDVMEMRIDIISLYYYGSESYGDYILKFNGISNPFAIEEGDTIYVPELISFAGTLTDNTKTKEDNRLLSVNGKNLNPSVVKYDKFAKNLFKSL